MKYYISKTLEISFENAVEKTIQSLKDEGFGIISEIDIHEKLKEKIQVDFRKYKILGACNPSFAYQALLIENKIGTMLPCNVIVQEIFENKIEVAVIDPLVAMQSIENDELTKIAKHIKNKLEKAIENIF